MRRVWQVAGHVSPALRMRPVSHLYHYHYYYYYHYYDHYHCNCCCLLIIHLLYSSLSDMFVERQQVPMRAMSAAASSTSGMTFNKYPFLRALGLSEMNHGMFYICSFSYLSSLITSLST
jgi:hypothetical protein